VSMRGMKSGKLSVRRVGNGGGETGAITSQSFAHSVTRETYLLSQSESSSSSLPRRLPSLKIRFPPSWGPVLSLGRPGPSA